MRAYSVTLRPSQREGGLTLIPTHTLTHIHTYTHCSDTMFHESALKTLNKLKFPFVKNPPHQFRTLLVNIERTDNSNILILLSFSFISKQTNSCLGIITVRYLLSKHVQLKVSSSQSLFKLLHKKLTGTHSYCQVQGAVAIFNPQIQFI